MSSGVSGGMRCPPGRRIVRIHHHSHPPISDRPNKISFCLIYRNEFVYRVFRRTKADGLRGFFWGKLIDLIPTPNYDSITRLRPHETPIVVHVNKMTIFHPPLKYLCLNTHHVLTTPMKRCRTSEKGRGPTRLPLRTVNFDLKV
jgi:hypothetical protein